MQKRILAIFTDPHMQLCARIGPEQPNSRRDRQKQPNQPRLKLWTGCDGYGLINGCLYNSRRASSVDELVSMPGIELPANWRNHSSGLVLECSSPCAGFAILPTYSPPE
jgi:hypothetical protein